MRASSQVYAMLLVKVHRREFKPEKRTLEIGNERSCNLANVRIKLLLYLF